LSHTSQGNLTSLFDDYCDAQTDGSFEETATYTRLIEQKCKSRPESVCLVTKCWKAAKAAKAASMNVVVQVNMLDKAYNVKTALEGTNIHIARQLADIEFTTT